MAEPDIAIIETDELLVRLERDIHATYAQAQEEMDKKLAKFMADFERKNKAKLALVSSGKMSQADYDKWLKGQAFQKQWYQAMVQTLSDDMVKTDQKAMSIVRGFTPEAYAINHNFAAYECESGAGLDANFTLYNRQTVERIMKDYPELLPTPKPDVVSDLAWHNKKVGNAVMQGILQGEGIPQIAKRLADVTGMDNRAAVRNARTAMTGAQNAGRIDTYKQAQDIGIDLQMEWNASLDSRTRDSHRILDGERRDIDKPFSNRCRYPADPQGPSHEIYNCRCYLRAVVDGVDDSARQRLSRLPEGITYEEWKAGKKFEEPVGKRSETYKMFNANDTGKHEFVSDVGKRCDQDVVTRVEIKKNASAMTSLEICEKLCGGDLTHGSCASLSLAYAGNVAGYDVLDFRGGASERFFSRTSNLNAIAKLDNVDGMVVSDFNDFTTAHTLLDAADKSKQYCFGVGRHMAIIRYNNDADNWEYLEMQSAYNNGFFELNDRTLRYRFGCQRSHSSYGTKYKVSGELIEVESLGNNRDFIEMLNYINTEPDKQLKGAKGSVK